MAVTYTCKLDWCAKPGFAQGYCSGHYYRWKNGLALDAPFLGENPANAGACSIPGCDRDAKSAEMCYGHYQRYQKGLRGEALNAPIKARIKKTGTCAVDGCGAAVTRSGLCEPHYNRKRKGLSVEDYIPATWGRYPAVCTVDGCGTKSHTRGLCGKHWQRFLRTGDPEGLLRPGTVEERFWSKVDMSSGDDACWPWTAFITPNGYGRFSLTHAKSVPAHRFAYENVNDTTIPTELQIEHVCHTEARKRGECDGGDTCLHRRCCNPAHLTVVDVKTQHKLRSESQTHCNRGHELTEENTYVRNNMRKCRKCAAIREKERRERKRKTD